MRKILFLTIAGIIVLVVIVIFIILSLPKTQSNPTGDNPLPTSQAVNKNELVVISILPQATTEVFLPSQQVQFTFNQPVLINSVSYSVTPNVATYTTQNEPNGVIISPKTIWNDGKTTITITGAKTVSGILLNQSVSYSFNSAIPTRQPEGSNY